MKNLLKDITTGRGEIPLFSSCTSFEYPESEYILYTGTPRLMFEVVDSIHTGDDTPRFFRFIEHNNGENDYLVLVDTFEEDGWFEGKGVEAVTEELEGVMDELEGWYVSEVIDLDSYED